MASLLRPVVPGVSSLGNILAQATQNAQVQSRTILAAASAIARQREQAGQLANDAIVRRRMERFQREQFEQKRLVENRRLELEADRLEIAQDANRRANAREPLELDLLQAQAEQAPVRTALLGQELVGAGIRNVAAGIELGALPQLMDDRVATSGFNRDLAEAGSAFEVYELENKLKGAQEAEASQLQIQDVMAGYDGTIHTMLDAATKLKAIKDNPKSQLNNPEVLQSYNAAVRALDLPDRVTQELILPDPLRDPLPPGGSRTLQLNGGQVTERNLIDPNTATGGLSSNDRLAMSEITKRLEARRDSEVRTIDDRISVLEKGLSAADGAKERAQIRDQIESQIKEKEKVEQRFRSDLRRETNRLIQAASENGVIENALFGGPLGFSNTIEFLKTAGIDVEELAQKKTRSVDHVPSFPNTSAPPRTSKPLPVGERTVGEFRVVTGPMVAGDVNDADSFFVKGPRGEEHFRLYFTDAPETGGRYPSKIRTQGDYFGIDEQDVVKVGQLAKKQTETWLKNEAYEVITRGERIMNSQRDHAMIYFPQAPLGERWLSERLVRNGLAMITTKGSKLPDGTTAEQFRKRLQEAEAVAKVNRLGAWAFTNQ